MNDGFTPILTVIDEWTVGDEKLRLVDLGCGPYVLQRNMGSVWLGELPHFSWSAITVRVKSLKKQLASKTA